MNKGYMICARDKHTNELFAYNATRGRWCKNQATIIKPYRLLPPRTGHTNTPADKIQMYKKRVKTLLHSLRKRSSRNFEVFISRICSKKCPFKIQENFNQIKYTTNITLKSSQLEP